MFAVPTPAFEYSVDITFICETVGVIDLPHAHPVYVIGIVLVNPGVLMFVQFCRRTGPDISLDVDVQAV